MDYTFAGILTSFFLAFFPETNWQASKSCPSRSPHNAAYKRLEL